VTAINAWFCTITAENWEKVKEHRIWGVPDTPKSRSKFRLIKPGDFLVFYLKSPTRAIIGTSSVASEVFIERSKSPWTDREYPHRVHLSEVRELSNPIPFSAIEGRLSKIRSGGSLFGNSIISLTEQDREIIEILGRQSS